MRCCIARLLWLVELLITLESKLHIVELNHESPCPRPLLIQKIEHALRVKRDWGGVGFAGRGRASGADFFNSPGEGAFVSKDLLGLLKGRSLSTCSRYAPFDPPSPVGSNPRYGARARLLGMRKGYRRGLPDLFGTREVWCASAANAPPTLFT